MPSTIRHPRPRQRPVQLSALLLLGGAALAAARPLLGTPRASRVPIEDTSRPPRHRGLTPLALLVGVLAVAGATSAALGLMQGHEKDEVVARIVGGDPAHGPQVARAYGCAGCHTIPGISAPSGRVGPPLDRLRSQVYLAGRVPNTPENLVRWIENPKAIDPHSAMPVTGISPKEARDIAAYLLTAR